MDSKDNPPPPASHEQLPPPPGMKRPHYRNPNAAALMGPTSTSQSTHYRSQFGSLSLPQHQLPQTLHQQQQTASSQSTQLGIEQNQNQQQQQVKRKRGRQRNFAPVSAVSNSSGVDGDGGGVRDSGEGGNANSEEPPAKRGRGRPPLSGKKLNASGSSGEVEFTPHVVEVNAGEDIASKVMNYLDHGPLSFCVLSGSGAVSRVTLRQDKGLATYEGRFEIITLSGSYMDHVVNGSINRSGSMSVALAGSDCLVFAGGVVGPLVAATQVHVIIGSFVTEAQKVKEIGTNTGRGQNPEPASAPASAPVLASGPVSASASASAPADILNVGSSSESSEENNNGIYGNSEAQQQQSSRPPSMQLHHFWP